MESSMDEKMAMEHAFELIKSDDYKQRVQGEILELKIRIEKLANFLSALNMDKIESRNEAMHRMHLNIQLNAMSTYMDILVIRAIAEEISINWIFEDED